MKTMTIAVVAVLCLAFVGGRVSAGTPNTGSAPDLSAGSEGTPAPDMATDTNVMQTTDTSGSDTTAAPAANPDAQASAVTPQVSAPPQQVASLGGACAGSGTYYVQGFGCTAGSVPALPTAVGPAGSCGGNAAPTVYGCTAGNLPTIGSPVGNPDGSNNCPGISHRTAMGCTPGLP